MADNVRVVAINVYPVKGMRPVSVQQAVITATGFGYDRNFVVVRESDAKFITQRQEPKLAQVEVAITEEALRGQPLPQDAALTLSAPGHGAVQVPLVRDRKAPRGRVVQATVWEWHGAAEDQGDEAASWLTAYLGRPARLLRYIGKSGGGGAGKDPARRPTDPDFAPGYEVGFADGFPYLLLSEETVADLNKQVPEDIPLNRFRPNIVVAGGEPWAEDRWESFQIVGQGRKPVEFSGIKPCSRCKVTTIDQSTAVVGDEPLKSMRSFRSGKVLGWAANRKDFTHEVFCGMNLVTRKPAGLVAVGDRIDVLRLRTDSWAPSAKNFVSADTSSGQMLRSALFMFLGPVLAAILYFLLNSPSSPFVTAKLR